MKGKKSMDAGEIEATLGVDNEDEEEVIDTTQPEFVEHFKGFTNQPQTSK